jgi:hypothetical protein
MSLVICDDGLVTLAQQRVTPFNNAAFRLRLFTNNHTPVVGDVASDYVEANFGGYTAIVLNAWSYYSITADVTLLQETLRFWQWASSPSNTIYGYFVTTSAGQLMWAELNPAGPVTLSTTSDLYVVLPRFTGQNL